MSLSIGIVGLPNVGKSTLFNALTKKSVDAANYPFCTIDPSVGVVAVPDERLARLVAFSASAKTVPAAIEFVDIAGLVEGAASGAGLGNQFLAHIRETDAIAHVVRIFDDERITHVHGKTDPVRDIEVVNMELALADMQTVDKRLAGIERECRQGIKEAIALRAVLEKIKRELDAGRLASASRLTDEERALAQTLHLLTLKPVLYALNKQAGSVNIDEARDERWKALKTFFEREAALSVMVDAGLENELKNMTAEEKKQFREDMGVPDDGINDLISAGYALLGLITFFTTGTDETRAWTIPRGTSAREAGAAIHSDFRDKFIRAEVIATETLLAAGSYAAARERGFARTEGKEYIVSDGDVIEFKI